MTKSITFVIFSDFFFKTKRTLLKDKNETTIVIKENSLIYKNKLLKMK